MATPVLSVAKHYPARTAVMVLIVGVVLMLGLFLGQRIHQTTTVPAITPVGASAPAAPYLCRVGRAC